MNLCLLPMQILPMIQHCLFFSPLNSLKEVLQSFNFLWQWPVPLLLRGIRIFGLSVCVCIWEWKRDRVCTCSEADPHFASWFEVSLGRPWQALCAEQMTQQALPFLRRNLQQFPALEKSRLFLLLRKKTEHRSYYDEMRRPSPSDTSPSSHLGHLLPTFSFCIGSGSG